MKSRRASDFSLLGKLEEKQVPQGTAELLYTPRKKSFEPQVKAEGVELVENSKLPRLH